MTAHTFFSALAPLLLLLVGPLAGVILWTRLERLKKEERKPYATSPITDRRHSFDIAPNEHLPDFIADGQELLPEWTVRGDHAAFRKNFAGSLN
jgi:hypothetical protein